MTHKRTIAVMQPYFFPYAGYFRLLAASDVFVIFDDVQFPRRGRVHRCEIAPGRWLTLPLAPAPLDILIKDLRWADDARSTLQQRLAAAGVMKQTTTSTAQLLVRYLSSPLPGVIDFLEQGLQLVAGVLDLKARMVRSSELGIDRTLRGQARVIAIVQALGGDCYVNAPGGRNLYAPADFAQANIELRFLAAYAGKFAYLLPAMFANDIAALREDVHETCRYAD